jgi:hypothetical protein
MATIKCSDEMAQMVEKFAAKKGITVAEAADKLLGTGFSRLGALARYAKAQAGEKPAPKKAKKAKGPIARKAKKAKAETVEQAEAAAS